MISYRHGLAERPLTAGFPRHFVYPWGEEENQDNESEDGVGKGICVLGAFSQPTEEMH